MDKVDQLRYDSAQTRTREAKSQLADSDALNDALISSIGDGIIIVNEHGNIAQVNASALQVLGYSKEELVGSWLPKALPSKDKDGNDVPTTERLTMRALMTGKPVSAIVSYLRRDGTIVPVASTVSPFLIDGIPRGAIIIFRDFSHELQVEKAKDEFVSLASHQLRTPLSSILIYSQILKDPKSGPLTSEQTKYLSRIQFSAEQMLELIGDFLNVAKLELGKLEINTKPTDLVKLIEEQISQVKPLLKSNNIKLEFHKPSKVPKTLTDSGLISQVIHNLLTNAVRYTDQTKGLINIKLSCTPKQFKIAIQDNGIGIPKEAQDQVFQRLYRAENARQSQEHGTGLGLYLVKKIVEACQAQVWFESEPGKGTTFYFTIPR